MMDKLKNLLSELHAVNQQNQELVKEILENQDRLLQEEDRVA